MAEAKVPLLKLNSTDGEIIIDFNVVKGRGSFKTAFRAEWKRKPAVAKLPNTIFPKIKNDLAHSTSQLPGMRADLDKDTALMILGKSLSDEFNQLKVSPKSIRYVDSKCMVVSGIKFIIEMELPGEWVRYGYPGRDFKLSQTLTGFIHYMFARNRGLVLTDLQGCLNGDTYWLMDAYLDEEGGHVKSLEDDHICSDVCHNLLKAGKIKMVKN